MPTKHKTIMNIFANIQKYIVCCCIVKVGTKQSHIKVIIWGIMLRILPTTRCPLDKEIVCLHLAQVIPLLGKKREQHLLYSLYLGL
jgi:hypothetical protein